MNIILLENIEKVGQRHEVVKVKDGYGRNYLLPKGLAIVANKSNLAQLEGLKKQAAKKEAALVNNLREIAAKLEGVTLKIYAKAGESGRLFGSVNTQHIAAALKDMGIDADKRIIHLEEDIKDLGTYDATVNFHQEVVAPIKVSVLAEE